MRYSCAVIVRYCKTTPPLPSFANNPTYNDTVYSTTMFTCNIGYQSTGYPSNPVLTCLPLDAANGQWNLTYDCQSMYGSRNIAAGF